MLRGVPHGWDSEMLQGSGHEVAGLASELLRLKSLRVVQLHPNLAYPRGSHPQPAQDPSLQCHANPRFYFKKHDTPMPTRAPQPFMDVVAYHLQALARQ